MFTFQRECQEKFGMQTGNHVWEECNRVMDCMPLCAIIDETIYAAHGGIPASTCRVELLYHIPVPLPDPSEIYSAWEILWADPVSRADMHDFLDYNIEPSAFPLFPPGFIPNIKRSTAYYFSEDALNQFFRLNSLSYLIRAHEVTAGGYQFAMDGKMMTIFSCSKYCGALNEAAMVFVDSDLAKMRVIKIETNQVFVDQ